MPDADKALGQAVKQEATDELNSGDSDRYNFIFLAILCIEDHHRRQELQSPTIQP